MNPEHAAKLREELNALDPADDALRELRDLALEAAAAAQLDEVKWLLSAYVRFKTLNLFSPRALRLSVAGVQAALGWVAMEQCRYGEAGSQFRKAALALPFHDREKHREYREAEADALYRQALEQGDATALRRAIALRRRLLRQISRAAAPLRWTILQNNLGSALQLLGERAGSTAYLAKAEAAFRSALDGLSAQKTPLAWALVQGNLAGLLLVVAERGGGGPGALEAAAQAYREALAVLRREEAPLSWAAAQSGLGVALLQLGEQSQASSPLDQAIEAFHAALSAFTREDAGSQRASTQHHLGAALFLLGERESSAVRLEEAAAAFRAALEERKREHAPLDWALTQLHLGEVLASVGTREGGVTRLMEAQTLFDSALAVFMSKQASDHANRARMRWAEAQRLIEQRRSQAMALGTKADPAQEAGQELPG